MGGRSGSVRDKVAGVSNWLAPATPLIKRAGDCLVGGGRGKGEKRGMCHTTRL